MRPIPPTPGSFSTTGSIPTGPRPVMPVPSTPVNRPTVPIRPPASVGAGTGSASTSASGNPTNDFILQFKKQLLPYLIQKINPALLNGESDDLLKQQIEQLIDEKLQAEKIPIGKQLRDKLMMDVINEMIGFSN